MATFNLCNQFDQIADGKVIYHGTEHTEYADLEQPEEEKPKKKFNGGSLFGKFLGGLVAVVAVSAVVGLAVAYAVSVVLTGGASLAALPAVAAGIGAMTAAVTAYEGGKMLEAQYNQDMANQEEGSWGDYIGGALVNTAQIGAEEIVMTILFMPAGPVGGRVLGFAERYGSKLFAKRAIGKTVGKWFGRGAGKVAAKTTTKIVTKNLLPNVEKATIDPRKLTEYALNPEHVVGGNKARVFESALGYNKSNAEVLLKQVQAKLPQSEAVLGKLDQYGQRYTVDMQILGANGQTATVRTGWIIRPGSSVPEMTTIFVK